ncbi:MAG: DUF6265 family protein [candidate division Zixibacteria bacterium]|nr:DUF6265 family protein [candidate division Zixibacteria bacterium]
MRRIFILLLFALLALFLPFIPKAQNKKPTLNDLRWLSGCWANGGTSDRYEEHWIKPAGTSVLGISHTVANDTTLAFEFLRIQQQKNGDIYYVADPSGQAQDSFKLVKFNAAELVFENPKHDFPQRIIYRRKGDSLFARIEGKSSGKEHGIDFPMKRAKCD